MLLLMRVCRTSGCMAMARDSDVFAIHSVVTRTAADEPRGATAVMMSSAHAAAKRGVCV
jgi:hypothetical protein